MVLGPPANNTQSPSAPGRDTRVLLFVSWTMRSAPGDELGEAAGVGCGEGVADGIGVGIAVAIGDGDGVPFATHWVSFAERPLQESSVLFVVSPEVPASEAATAIPAITITAAAPIPTLAPNERDAQVLAA